jgi:rhamnosyl/mannosyltransferase
LGLAERVFFLGDVADADLPAYYAAADLFVLPACERSEAFGVVQVEALASGTPIVSTELGTGTSYVNQDGVTGRVVPAGEAAALAGALRTLLADRALRHVMGMAARQRAASEFSLPVMVGRIENLYRSLGAGQSAFSA